MLIAVVTTVAVIVATTVYMQHSSLQQLPSQTKNENVSVTLGKVSVIVAENTQAGPIGIGPT